MKGSARRKARAMARRAREAAARVSAASPPVLTPEQMELMGREVAAFFERPSVKAAVKAVEAALHDLLTTAPGEDRRSAAMAAVADLQRRATDQAPLVEPAPPFLDKPEPIKGAN